MRNLIAAFCFILAAPGFAGAQECPSPPENDEIDFGAPITLELVTDAETFSFETAIADEPAEHARGMMFRTEMDPDAAMLFLFETDSVHRFWMRNTCIPLDILYVRNDGVIIGIAHEAQPLSEILLPSPGPVRAVLELAGGEAERRGIAAGDRVVHEALSE